MERPQEYSSLEIAFIIAALLSNLVLFFSILIWLYALLQSSYFAPVVFYSISVGIGIACFIFAIKRRYYTHKENLCVLFTDFATTCIYFLNHMGIFPIGSALIIFGGLCNIAVISANGFYMPIDQCAEHHIKAQKNYFLYTFHNSETKLKFLSDVITLGAGCATVSVGDFFIVGGRWVMFAETCWWLVS